MDDRDRQAIDELFDKIGRVEAQAGPRDAESEAYLRALIAQQPSAAYYLAQTVIVQEQALNAAQRRIEDMESQPQGRATGGFLDSLFGGGQPQRRAPASSRRGYEDPGPWGGRGARGGMGMGGMGMGGGGFLAGAAQTAMGVAGGVVLGNMLAGMLSPDEAAAAGIEPGAGGSDANTDTADAGDASGNDFADAGGGDFDAGGDFDLG